MPQGEGYYLLVDAVTLHILHVFAFRSRREATHYYTEQYNVPYPTTVMHHSDYLYARQKLDVGYETRR